MKIKIEGDRMLREAEDISLHERKLSTCDAVTISLCRFLQIPIVTGDKDLKYVAEKLNVKVLW